eukprot:Pgem_evm1s4239
MFTFFLTVFAIFSCLFPSPVVSQQGVGLITVTESILESNGTVSTKREIFQGVIGAGSGLNIVSNQKFSQYAPDPYACSNSSVNVSSVENVLLALRGPPPNPNACSYTKKANNAEYA